MQACEGEATRDGLSIVTEQDCFNLVKTVCKEHEELVNNEVCATYYEEIRVQAEIKTVTATFEKVCRVEEICHPPVLYSGGRCRDMKTRNVCFTQPDLVPIVRKVRKEPLCNTD